MERIVNDGLFLDDEMTNSRRVLHTPSDMIRKSFLYMQEVGYLKSIMPHTCSRDNLKSYLIVIVLDGKGTITCDNKTYAMNEGDCAYIDCNKAYSHRSSDDKPWSLKWIHFYGANVSDYYDIFLERNKNNIVFTPKKVEIISGIINRIIAYDDQKNFLTELKVSNDITQLMTNCIETISEEVSLEEIRSFINNNYGCGSLIAKLSDEFGISEQKLDEDFNKNYGILLQDYILIRRFTKAKELLRFTILDIEDIIVQSGIRNDDLFRRLFIENEGISPEEYRKKWAQWFK